MSKRKEAPLEGLEEEYLEDPAALSPPSALNQFFSKPWVVAYRILGDRVERVLGLFMDLKPNLMRSGLRISFPAYVSLIIFISGIVFLGAFASTIILGLIFKAPILVWTLVGTAIGLLGWSITFATLYAYPSLRADSLQRKLDEELPYAASHMAVLATAGMTPERIVRSLAISVPKDTLTNVARTVVRDIDLLGMDLISALEAARDRSPSRQFAEFLDGLIATVRSGGDLRKYLLLAARGMMETRRQAATKLVQKLGAMGEVYIALLVVFPLIVIIMLAIMGIISGGLAGVSVILLMNLLTFVLVPMLAAMMLILLDAIMPRA